MSTDISAKAAGIRGPAEHSIRDQIVQAADAHFRHYGYAKTTVSDLANAIGFSKAYIYKFFDSKQAIGEAICTNCLDGLLASARAAVADGTSATDKLRRFFKILVESGVALMFEDRKLYDIAAHSALEKWDSGIVYQKRLIEMIRAILVEGRQSGEFERKTPLDETSRAIKFAMTPFIHPVMLEQHLDVVPDASNEVISLILRSLAP